MEGNKVYWRNNGQSTQAAQYILQTLVAVLYQVLNKQVPVPVQVSVVGKQVQVQVPVLS